MSQHFNAPPGWPVPPGWQPPPGWEPDPSWPPAPAGWRFFVDAEADADADAAAEQPPPRLSRRHAALLAGALAAVITLVAGTVAAVLWFTGSESAPLPRPAGMLAGTYPTQPQSAWSVQASSLVQGSDVHFATPESGLPSYAYGYASNPEVSVSVPGAIIVGDHVLSQVVTSDGTDAHLVSLSTADGHVDWSLPITGIGCARSLLDHTLPCLKSSGSSDHSTVEFIDVDTGTTKSTVQVPFPASLVETDGRSLYTAGSDGSQFVVAKGSPDNPTDSWKTTVSQDQCPTPRGDSWGYLRVAHGLVWGHSGLFVGEAALHAQDGSPVFDHGVTSVLVPEDGSTVSATRCTTDSDQDDGATDVAGDDGQQLFTSSDAPIPTDLDVHTGGSAMFVTATGDVLDPVTGDKRTHLDPAQTYPSVAWRVGRVVVVNASEGEGGSISGYDITSGKQLWHTTAAAHFSGSHGAVTDGVRLLVTNASAGIDAVTIADGTTAWSMAGSNSGMRALYATDTGLLSVSGTTIGLLKPTGPAAVVPGVTDGEGSDGSGGTRLVTKCGRTPQFVPEAIHTDSGALVIRMKIVAYCPGGDVLASPETAITVTSDGQNVAAGTFDLSGTPIVVPPDPGGADPSRPAIEHDFRFPLGTFWRLPVSTNEAPVNGASSQGPVDFGVKTIVVACQESGSGKTTAPSGKDASSAPVSASTATGPASPASGDNESASADALRAIADADRPFVASNLADHWVPQLSSKRPGTVDDGITWDNAATLQEHLKLRLAYPEARLLWSGDWSTFSAPDFWVTIAGVTFPDADGALAWCRDHHRDSDHCYAKLVSKTHPVEGSTAFNP